MQVSALSSSDRLARLRDVLAELGRPTRGPVALIVSELVANAVMHARTDMSVSVELDGDGVRVP